MKYGNTLAMAALVGLIGTAPLASAQQDARERRVGDGVDVVRDGVVDSLRLRCGSTGMNEIGMRAHYIRYRERGIGFGATFGAESAGQFHAGDELDVLLAGIPVGAVTLERLDTGELVGRIALRYQPDVDPSRTDVDLERIEVRRGSSVVVGPLGCALKS